MDKLYELLSGEGMPVTRYHAGMNKEDRKESQNDFIFDRLPVIVATNAFGMGIDKSNVRFVIHYNMPQSMENYYQAARCKKTSGHGELLQDLRVSQKLYSRIFWKETGEAL